MKWHFSKVGLAASFAAVAVWLSSGLSGLQGSNSAFEVNTKPAWKSTISRWWILFGPPSANAATAQGCKKRGCRVNRKTRKCVCLRQNRSKNPAGIKWIKIPGGTFQMGSRSGDKDELPVHRVKIKTFWMAKTEVTVSQYRKCVHASRCSKPKTGKHCNWSKRGRANHPINCVVWKQARVFSRWVGGRLSSEAEWEYAARSGGKDWKYPWGNDAASCARAVMNVRNSDPFDQRGDGCDKYRTWVVCSKSRGNSRHGLCDLAGNVWEWVEDRWHRNYNRAPTDGSAWISGSSSYKVVRGGSWYNSAQYVRGASRGRTDPKGPNRFLGFRPTRSSPP